MTHIWEERTPAWVAFVSLSLMFLTIACSSATAAIPQTECYKREGLDPKAEAVIDAFRASVPAAMKKGKVPGYAVALVDERGIIYTEGFGHTSGKKKTLVTPDTSFLLCGVSKLITATAVMLAVQDGLLALDEPIVTYLPDLKLNSRYEEHPEGKITLRHLLHYTAGLPAEAPLGNYFEPSPRVAFEDHVKSLFGSWLVCPVGSHFLYSGMHSDLAAYALQVTSGMPFERYMQERVFTVLGMSNTTLDRDRILSTQNRAVGSMMGISKMPAVYPALGTGGVYSSARDMARFVQLHLNGGTLQGQPVLDEALMAAIHRPRGIVRDDPNAYVFYGMGVYIDKRAPENTELILWHDGWGFGFASFVIWYPEYGVGTVALMNRLPMSVTGELALSLTDRLVKGRIVEKRFPQPHPTCDDCLTPWRRWPNHQPTPYRPQWKPYCGTHHLRFTGYRLQWWAELAVLILGRDEYTPRIKVRKEDGFLCVTESRFFEQVGLRRHVSERLQEVKPGLFTTASGITLDFTRDVPIWRNYRLEKR